VNLTLSKSKPLLLALIAVLGVSMFLIGQDVLAQDVVITEIGMGFGLEIPQREANVSFEAEAYSARIYIGALERGCDVRETSGDKHPSAQVYFSNNMTIYNATGHVIFNRTMIFRKGADRTIMVYAPLEDVEPGTSMTIVMDIDLRITLPTPEDTPSIKNTITKTIHKEITVPVTG